MGYITKKASRTEFLEAFRISAISRTVYPGNRHPFGRQHGAGHRMTSILMAKQFHVALYIFRKIKAKGDCADSLLAGQLFF